ncbi:hypothetical protein [Hymenobacter perfusus]|uniref:Uncharacterized protein n=1 Tax=Hymenobacter perfusus TaxID=1236770 RepID=A0A3R9NDF7_9BACT|nr:hypothetical protein [Hymenobacter perfusus]RSK44644.1 hypothetical protein EI293_09025 [Hymenobacter perfusus]
MDQETQHAPCFLVVTHRNLCADYQLAKWATAGLGVLLLAVIGFSNQLIRKKISIYPLNESKKPRWTLVQRGFLVS